VCLRHLLFDDLHLIFIFGAHSVIRCAHRYIRYIRIQGIYSLHGPTSF
tara:strand:+ start:245 stop:388 length:144 start_codon:yes stop_codon:yes gene_type:complete